MYASTLVVVSLLFQVPSPTIQPEKPVIKNGASSRAGSASANISHSKLPPSQSRNTEAPSAAQSAPDKNAEQQQTPGRIYKVDVVSPSAKPLDTPLFPVYLFFTGIGVFVNVWIACLIYRQNRLNRHQVRNSHIATKAAIRSARASKRSADAAVDSANALVNSERAWVIPELQCDALYTGGRWYWRNAPNVPLTPEATLAGNHLVYKLKLTNMGRTSAQILRFRINYTLLGEGIRDIGPQSLCDHYESREFIRLLDTRESVEIEEPKIDVHKFISKERDAVRNLHKTAVINGWVKYRHMFSGAENCYADFCYSYKVSADQLISVGRHTAQRQQKDEPEENED